MELELQAIHWILAIIVAIIAIIGTIWRVRKYMKKQYGEGYSKGKEDGQVATQNARFLIRGDEIIVGEDVMKRGNQLLQKAKSQIKIITFTGAAWMLGKTKEIIEEKAKRGVQVQLVLNAPPVKSQTIYPAWKANSPSSQDHEKGFLGIQ